MFLYNGTSQNWKILRGKDRYVRATVGEQQTEATVATKQLLTRADLLDCCPLQKPAEQCQDAVSVRRLETDVSWRPDEWCWEAVLVRRLETGVVRQLVAAGRHANDVFHPHDAVSAPPSASLYQNIGSIFTINWKTNRPQLRIDDRPNMLQYLLTITLNRDLLYTWSDIQSLASNGCDPHTHKKINVKDQLVQMLEWKQMDG